MPIPYIVSDMASDIYSDEFDSSTGHATLSSISGWLANNIGTLNTEIHTSFSGSGTDSGDTYFQPTGSFGFEEMTIYKKMYIAGYYDKKARNVLNTIGASVDFLSIKEGDTVITRTNKNEISKTYRGFAKDNREDIVRLVEKYNAFSASPRQVAGYDGSLSGTY